MNPSIIEERKLNLVAMDVFSRLMQDRIIFLGAPIDDDVANIVQAQLLFLASTDQGVSDISIYLNTPGGVVSAGLGIYDTMQIIEPDVATICTGQAASMGAVLLCAGTKGKRSVLEHSRVMIHQPLGGAQGQTSDILIAAKEIEKCRTELYRIIAKHSGQPFDKVFADGDRDFWMDAKEAVAYGMVDKILTGKKK
ncbi:MAG: ATP-dependent Clp protease proteolytic subunit [Bacteroidales bacterium]|nr:ATP-dependent Clp protease proteolytic subunit [Bacteroidales bacterium]